MDWSLFGAVELATLSWRLRCGNCFVLMAFKHEQGGRENSVCVIITFIAQNAAISGSIELIDLPFIKKNKCIVPR